MPVFNGVTLVITLDAPTLGVLNINVQDDLYEAWKNWQLEDPKNRGYPQLFRSVAGDPLVDPLNIAPYFFIQNQSGWRIISSDADQEVNYIGNIVPEDSTLPIIIPTPGRTVLHLGLQPITQGVRALQATMDDVHGQVRRSVWVDTSLVANGNGYQQSPFNNFTDAADYAETNNLQQFMVLADATLDRQLRNFSFIGVGNPTIDVNGQDINRSEFEFLQLDGTMVSANGVTVHRCELRNNFAGLNGKFDRCGLGGILTLASGADVEMIDCHSSVGGSGRPTVNGLGGATNFALRGFRGGLNVGGISNVADEYTISMPEGKLTLLATCTDGFASIRGQIQFTNSSAGTTLDLTALVDTEQVRLAQELAEADEVFDQTAGLLHYYRKNTVVDLIPPKTVVTTQTQDTSLVEV